MVESRCNWVLVVLLCLSLTNCNSSTKNNSQKFDELTETVKIDNWQFSLNVQNQNKRKGMDSIRLNDHYLKATLYLSNVKTKKSLLYSLSDGVEDYEAKYKYLSFGSRDDLYISYKDELIYPIGYVFEPSNGLSNAERLVYKFQISDNMYQKLMKGDESVKYWYTDRLIGLGKICFTHND